jgi:tape measure domain-containing protein
VAEVEKAIRDLDLLDKAAGKNINSFEDLGHTLGRLAEVAALGKALDTVKNMGAFALSTADTFQIARNEFGVLLGDMEAGAGLFNQIKAFNDKTPFSLDTLTQATEVLLAAKVSLSDLETQLSRFGDLSQGSSEKFISYINAFSKASAKGKADMETLNTYINQGVPILDALAQQFGATTAEIVEMTSQGKIGFEEFSTALETLTAAGGQYFGGMELGSQSLAAMQEGMNEAINSLAASFGEMFLPAALETVEALTAITNAINNSPIVKGVLVGALVTLTGYLSAMAVKATAAFAAQMSLNLAVGVLNPVVFGATIAVGVLAAGYTAYSAHLQQANRETENFALQQRKQKEATDDSAAALERYARTLKDIDDEQIRRRIGELEAKSNVPFQIITPEAAGRETAELEALYKTLSEHRTSFIDSLFSGSQAGKIERINQQLAVAKKYLNDSGLRGGEESKLQEIVRTLTADLEKLSEKAGESISEIDRAAAGWKASWAEVWEQFQAGQSIDPFAGIELERGKKLTDAYNNYVRAANQETIDQINAYYDTKRTETADRLLAEEQRRMRGLTESRIDDLEYELREALNSLDTLEAQRVIAAGESEEAILAIRERYAAMRARTEEQYARQIADARIEDAEGGAETDPVKERLEKAKAGIVDWRQVLADNISLALMDIEGLGDETAVILGELSAQFVDLAASSTLDGFKEFGRALGEGKDVAEAFSSAMAQMAQQMLDMLPQLFLQAGLNLIAQGQWALGLGFIVAAGSASLLGGYTDGLIEKEKSERADRNARGNVFDQALAKAYARGGSFTNQIVQSPTYFRHGGGLGLMGEAGPEAIIPLKRMPNGDLGVEGGAGGGTNVVVNIINNSGAEVQKRESADGDGNRQIDVIIGQLINQHLSSGKADRALAGRYDVRTRGV